MQANKTLLENIKKNAATPASTAPPLLISDMSWGLTGAFSLATLILVGLVMYTLGQLGDKAGSLAWFISRGTGIAAYLLLSTTMIYGLTLSTRSATGAAPPPVMFAIHEFASWLGLIFTATHALVLMFDHYIHFSLFSIITPFMASYRPEWVGLGQVGFYITLLLTVSFYIKKKIGQRAWRIIHYASFISFVFVTLHGIYSGSDTKSWWVSGMYWLSASSSMLLLLFRILLSIGKTAQPNSAKMQSNATTP